MSASVWPETKHPYRIYLDVNLDHSIENLVDCTAEFEKGPKKAIPWNPRLYQRVRLKIKVAP